MPIALRGSASTKNTRFGALNLASRPSSAARIDELVERRAGSRTTTAVTPSPKSGCGSADHRALDDAGERVDLALDLLRIDVEAAGDDEVLGAPDDVDVAARVDLAEIAGDEEAVGGGTRPRSFPASANSP